MREVHWGDVWAHEDLSKRSIPSGELSSLMRAYGGGSPEEALAWWVDVHRCLRHTCESQDASAVVLKHLVEAHMHAHFLLVWPGDGRSYSGLTASIRAVGLWVSIVRVLSEVRGRAEG